MAADGSVWVVDSGNNRLQVFTAAGRPLRTIPVPGWSGPNLKEGYLAFTAGGALLLTDPLGGRLLRLTAGGIFETVASGLQGPAGVAVHGEQCYVTERGPSRLKRIPLG